LPTRDTPLVGRDHDLSTVLVALRSDDHRAVVVAGPAGVGKTRLVREATARLDRSGRRYVTLTGTRAASSIPFGALAPIFDSDVGEINPIAAARRELLARAGEKRLLVVVDDAHLLDGPSALVLWQLSTEGRIDVLATVRLGEAVPEEVHALWRDGPGLRLELLPLSADDTTALCQAVLGGDVDPVLASTVHGLSGGLPLFVRELLIGAVAAGDVVSGSTGWTAAGPFRVPPRVTDLVAARLDALGPASRDALEMVALAEPMPLGWLDDVADTDVIDDLERRGFIVTQAEQGSPARAWLAHPLAGELLRDAIPAHRRRRHALRLAGLVGGSPGSSPADVVRVARWRLDAGLPADSDALLIAAQELLRVGDYRGAAELAGEAWASARTVPAGHLLGRLLAAADRGPDAEAILADAAEIATELEDRAAIAITRSENLLTLGDDEGALALARGAIDDAVAGARRDELVAHLGFLELTRGRADRAIPLLEPLLSSDDPATVVATANAAGMVFAFDGRPQTAVELAERAYAIHKRLWAERILSHEPEVHLVRRVYGLVHLGRLHEAEEATRSLFSTFLDAGIPVGLPIASLLQGMVALEQGRLAAADLWFTRSAEYFVRHDRGARRRWALAPLLLVSARRGDLAKARQVAAELDGLTALGVIEPVALVARGWLAWREGRHGDADDLIRAGALLAWETSARSFGIAALHDLAVLGLADTGLGDVRSLAGDVEGPLLEAKLAAVEAAIDDDPAGLCAAGATFEELGADLAAAEAFGRAATTMRRTDPVKAARLFARGAACEERCEGAFAEALTVGRSGLLTGRELEVASLAAAGLASKQIAKDLGVSRRTVDNLLSRAYRKLGVTSRGQLAEALGSVRG
jgi:DNA-binding CsgD family transcriptional regulator/tetratricopeptide (TPR) repeat protein